MSELKKIEYKGVIAAMAAALSVFSYVIYYFHFYETGEKLNKLFFISTGVSIFIFSGLLFTFFHNKLAKTMSLFCSIFYVILVSAYVISGLFFGHYYAHIKFSLFIGLFVGLTYYVYDTFIHAKH